MRWRRIGLWSLLAWRVRLLERVACASVEAATQLHALLSEACGQVARRRAASPWQRQLLLE
jgi:hypothetical protein